MLLLFAITIALFAGNWQAPFIYDDVIKIAENLDSRRAAWCAAQLFIVLPIHAGTVLYAYGLSDVLVAFLSLAALLVLLSEGALRPWRMIGFGFVCFGFSS